jgi:hypothetical protein
MKSENAIQEEYFNSIRHTIEANKNSRCRMADSVVWWTIGVMQDKEEWEKIYVTSQWIIESKPMEIWVNVWTDGFISCYKTKEEANQTAGLARLTIRTAKFREVTDD